MNIGEKDSYIDREEVKMRKNPHGYHMNGALDEKTFMPWLHTKGQVFPKDTRTTKCTRCDRVWENWVYKDNMDRCPRCRHIMPEDIYK